MIGRLLAGRYRVLDKLGEGGWGQVYLAEHVHLHRKEALKILNPALAATPEAVSRFRREARATNRLQHPNIVSVYDFGQLPDGRFYLAVEYAEGESLATALGRVGRLPVSRMLPILAQLADAIDHAHSRGVIHRDLKPANMILKVHRNQSDFLKVLDFGISKIIAPGYQDSLGATETGSVYGTPGYMAPEQYRGDGADPRIDIYAAGCVAFETLVGELPYRGGWADVMDAIVNKPVPRPSQRCPEADIPPELDDLVMRCLAKDAEQRIQSGKGLRLAVEAIPGFTLDRQSSGRRRYKSAQIEAVPDVFDFDDVETDISAGDRGRSAREIGDALADQDTEIAVAEERTVGVAESVFHVAVRALAEALVDQGYGDFQLSIGLANLSEIESELERCVIEMDMLDTQGRAIDQRRRERETSLRFAIGELRFERDQARAKGRDIDASVDVEIEELQRRLGVVMAEAEHELSAITDREISLAVVRAGKEDELSELCDQLDKLLSQLVPDASETPAIRSGLEQLAHARRLREMATMATERPK